MRKVEGFCERRGKRSTDQTAAVAAGESKEGSENMTAGWSERRTDLEWRTMKAIFSVVTASAAMMRSPSFSRSVESRTMMNSPFPFARDQSGRGIIMAELRVDILNATIVSSIESKWDFCIPFVGICIDSALLAQSLYNYLAFMIIKVDEYDPNISCGVLPRIFNTTEPCLSLSRNDE